MSTLDSGYDNSPVKRVAIVGDDGQPSAGASQVSLGTKIAGEDLTNDVLKVRLNASYTNLTASALIKTGAGTVGGFSVNSHTSGTLKLWDNTSAATTVLTDTYTFPAGSSVVNFGQSVNYSTGLFATIGGTANITIFWN